MNKLNINRKIDQNPGLTESRKYNNTLFHVIIAPYLRPKAGVQWLYIIENLKIFSKMGVQ